MIQIMQRIQFIKNFFKNCPVKLYVGHDVEHTVKHSDVDIKITSRDIKFVVPTYADDLEKYFKSQGIDYTYLDVFKPSDIKGFVYYYKYIRRYNEKDYKKVDINKNIIHHDYNDSPYRNSIRTSVFSILSTNDNNLGWLNLFKCNLKEDIGFYKCDDNLEDATTDERNNCIINQIRNDICKYSLSEILAMWNEYMEILNIEKMSKNDLILLNLKTRDELLKLKIKIKYADLINMTKEELLNLYYKYSELLNTFSEINF